MAVNTNVDMRNGGTPPYNLVFSATINVTENTVTCQVSAGAERSVMFYSPDTDWYYRSAASGTNLPVTKGQTLTLAFPATQTIYFVRQTGDGTLIMLPLDQFGQR